MIDSPEYDPTPEERLLRPSPMPTGEGHYQVVIEINWLAKHGYCQAEVHQSVWAKTAELAVAFATSYLREAFGNSWTILHVAASR